MEVASTLNRYSGPASVNVSSSSFHIDSQPRLPLLPTPNFPPQGPVIAGPSTMPNTIGPPGINAPSGMPGPGGGAGGGGGGGAPPPPPTPRMPGPAPFINFDPLPAGPMMNFEQMPLHLRPPDFSPVPPVFGPPNPPLRTGPLPVPVPLLQPGPAPGQLILGPPGLPLPVPSPQPVPAPGIPEPPSVYNSLRQISPNHKSLETNKNINHSSQQSTYHDCRPSSPYNIQEMTRDERLKTPEPPVISNSKVIIFYSCNIHLHIKDMRIIIFLVFKEI